MKVKPFDGLTLCLIDPTDCSIPFETIKAITSEAKKCDFIISFFDKTDFHRNAVNATLNESFISTQKKYLDFLGSNDFFSKSEVIAAAKMENHRRLSELFLDEYKRSLINLGFSYQDIVSIGHFYQLLFATGNKTGMRFWNATRKFAPNGQGEFSFE